MALESALRPNEVLEPSSWGRRYRWSVAHTSPHQHRFAWAGCTDQGMNVSVRLLLFGLFLQGLRQGLRHQPFGGGGELHPGVGPPGVDLCHAALLSGEGDFDLMQTQ